MAVKLHHLLSLVMILFCVMVQYYLYNSVVVTSKGKIKYSSSIFSSRLEVRCIGLEAFLNFESIENPLIRIATNLHLLGIMINFGSLHLIIQWLASLTEPSGLDLNPCLGS